MSQIIRHSYKKLVTKVQSGLSEHIDKPREQSSDALLDQHYVQLRAQEAH